MESYFSLKSSHHYKKIHYFGKTKCHDSGRKHGGYINDSIFYPLLSSNC